MKHEDCATIQPLLFAALEDGLAPETDARLAAHLSACAPCRAELVAERSLTSLLGGVPLARRNFARRALPGALAATLVAGALVSFLASEPRAYGSSSPQRLTLPALAWQEGEERPLAAMNHLELSDRDRVTYHIDGVGTLTAVGPAAFELDGASEGWKLVLLRGEVVAEIDPGGELLAVTAHGARALTAGRHVVDLLPPSSTSSTGSPGELIARGIEAFFQADDMPAAERDFRAAAEHPAATDEQKNQALFYWSAALSRLERYEESLTVSRRWLELYPDDEKRDYVLFFEGVHQQRLGRTEEARRTWEGILEEFPDSNMVEHARASLDGLVSADEGPPRSDRRAELTSATSAAMTTSAGSTAPELESGEAGGYVVVEIALDPEQKSHAAFLSVAEKVADFHDAALLPFDGSDFDGLAAALAAADPRYVLYVVGPERLDVDLHRRLLLLSAKLDSDPFPDFAFGYFTARDGDALEALWRRTRERHAKGLGSKRWESCFVTGAGESMFWEDYIPEAAKAAGFRGRGMGFAVVEHDPRVLEFVERELETLEDAAVIDITGNGDPQGVWLFDDHRNIDGTKHWEYAPELVGHDPEGEMPRIEAERWRALELDAPVVWSGTCHSASTRRVFVEGDIVSTFGRAEPGTLHELAPEEAFSLALLDAGAVALLAPIAANHGYTVMLENDFALTQGASLGDAIKSTWDDVFLQARGELALELHGGPPAREDVMQGGGANRILIGDPALDLFEPTAHPLERVELEPHEGGFDVTVTWGPGFHSGAWDMFGGDCSADGRIRARVDVTELVAAGASVRAEVEAEDLAGKSLPYRMRHAALESFAGRRYLHLQANAPRTGFDDSGGMRAVFRVTLE